ncbi:CLOCK-interacting pacemaker [Anoplopoma fimbria]|uniref:CLOCK-interacting pacemaker n=1 Tax=Anoplopoma fimbria TaxID=229290 RepID=UPI0023EBBB54|nr:CLOCK-interacting pacemaker [Anoplopoma fimbria]XP_054454259.1 CLOCK-interacting pacemaker [Anoplopoma fimbria]XP_054454260.1 CLOCK-interacting pacemaker [Anoplopoma fimbria]
MPKEQPCSGEHSSCATSSKNAKNKSNRMTLLAMRDTKDADDSTGRASRCSSEKDSGYSDGHQTDVEDQQSNKSQCRGGERAETSRPGQNRDLRREDPGKPTLTPADRELPPIYIINNIVIKQPDMIQKRDQLPERNSSREDSSSGSAHMILFQQPSTSPASRQLHKPMSRRSNVTGRKINGTYIPILNSYPRIAPHPSKKPPDKPPSNDESQNLSKRVCTEHEADDTPVIRSLPEHLHEQPKLAALTSRLPCSSSTTDGPSSSSPTTVSLSQSSPSGSGPYATSSTLKTRGPHRNGTSRTRQHRFLNTVEILRQSGLLDITLRTKELLRQSNATERDIAQLRQHTELLFRAVSNPGCTWGDTTAFEHLHRAMAESGGYPNIKKLQDFQIPCNPDSASQPAGVATGDADGPPGAASSSSRILTTIQIFNSGMELNAGDTSSEKDTFMPPDSSTD